MEDNLNETAEIKPRPSLSRFNSVKRKQLERLRQRSDWFLGPNASTSLEQQSSEDQITEERDHQHQVLQPKSSGNSVTKASSEGAGLDICILSDADSVFSDTSRSESPASEPVRSPAVRISRDIIHSDTIEDVQMAEHEARETTDEDMAVGDTEICYFVVEHKYGEPPES